MSDAGGGSPTRRILYLEDDPRDIEPVTDRLQRSGIEFELTVARDRAEFEAALSGGPFDLILADYSLPAYDGMTALADARARDPDVPFLLISGVLGEGQAVDCVLAGATDYVLKNQLDRLITAARRALDEAEEHARRRAAEAQLRVVNERYRKIVQNANQGIWVLDPERRTTSIHGTLAKMLGYSAEEMRGRRPEEFLGGPDADREDTRRFLAEVDSETTVGEIVFRAKSGADVTALVSKSGWPSPAGTLECAVLMLTDISARKAAEAERAELHAQLQRANRLEILGVLAGGVAHDLDNVLSGVLGIASLNMIMLPPESQEYRDFETVNNAALRGSELLGRMLDFARGGAGSRPQILDINGLVREATAIVSPSIARGIDLELDLAEDLRPVRGDASDITQALMNLLVNAAEAIADKGKLYVSTRNAHGRLVEIVVRDSGAGMSEEVRDKLFDPFFTTKARGTGLGMSIVQQTIDNHLGTLDIDSTLGEGTRVVLRFPRWAPVPEGATTRRAASAQESLQLLVIDDDDSLRRTAERIVGRLGHTVVGAADAQAAFAHIAAGLAPDAVLLSMGLPGRAGVQTYYRLRDERPQVPIIITTTRHDTGAQTLAEGDPGTTVLAKPFTVDSLRRHIDLVTSDRA